MTSGVITLLTDFGLADPFVGVMKGVILDVNPRARVVDLTHAIPPQDVTAANFALRGAFAYFPRGTVHVAVVDPGVGSARRILCAEAHGMTFLAPDNGLLGGIVTARDRVREVTNRTLFRAEVSQTFHGRDVFAPVAARLAAGLAVDEVGAPVASLRALEVAAPRRLADGAVVGRVVHVDGFGNLISNVRAQDVLHLRDCVVHLGGRAIGPLLASYAAAPEGSPLAIVDSLGLIEIAVNRGNAAKELAAGQGAEVRCSGLTAP